MPSTRKSLDSYNVSGLNLRPGKCVELLTWIEDLPEQSFPKASYRLLNYGQFPTELFLRIVEIVQSESGQISLRGNLFCRTKFMVGLIKPLANEVCQLFSRMEGTHSRDELEGIFEVPARYVSSIRVLNKTNALYPRHSFTETRKVPTRSHQSQLDNERLTCRWKKVAVWPVNRDKGMPLWAECEISRINEAEADECYRARDKPIRFAFRGQTIENGSKSGYAEGEIIQRPDGVNIYVLDGSNNSHSQDRVDSYRDGSCRDNAIELDEDTKISIRMRSLSLHNEKGRYTFGDMFCGAGGVSRGAYNAGLALKFAVDNNPHAIQSYLRNFGWANICEEDVSLWYNAARTQQLRRPSEESEFKVDILHLSPPCQPFSDAHTVNGPNDDANQAALTSIGPVLEICVPRVVTIEETSGIQQEKHREWFHRLVIQFTDMGYSVRVRMVNCVRFGVPQTRKRLLIIASCPGEVLPKFPAIVHGEAEGEEHLLPYVMPWDKINGITTKADHNPEDKWFRPGEEKEAWDPTQEFVKTITTHGGLNNYHPSGLRKFTDREYACLQTFPEYHKFSDHGVLKQIGNAVPPILAEHLFNAVKEALLEADSRDEQQDNDGMNLH